MKILIAPMAGVTDYNYRQILKRFHPDYIFTEMVSSNAIVRGNEKTLEQLLKVDQDESVQIFGKDIDIMLEAAKYIESIGVPHLDINAGCPMKKIVQNGYGAALLADLQHLDKLLYKLKSNLKIPISLKIRIGYKNFNLPLEATKIAEKNDFKFVTVHGRTREQLYTGKADWEIIKNIKQNSKIPIIGNGDIFSYKDAVEKARYSNVDGIMLARGIMGYPWLIREIQDYIRGNEIITVTSSQKIDMAIEHYKLAIENKSEKIALYEMRKHLCWYIKGIPNSTTIKDLINHEENTKVVINSLLKLKSEK